MRNILREIFERYLNAEQAAFDASPRELWPTERFVPRPQAVVAADDDLGQGGTAPDTRKAA
jgi:hypothetical protein